MMSPQWKSRILDIAAAAGSFLFAAGLVVAVTWPWAAHFSGELLAHWDPPFHAWKLEFMAKRIIAGDILLASGNTNMLYPNSGALYFEALQYPASLLGAVFFAATDWTPEFIYHVTMLLMWALSAPFMFAFLRSLGISRTISFFTSGVFCILPYRISYVNEFQMQFAFGTPLFMTAALRFIRKPGLVRGASAAAAMWLYAITELNQAAFNLFVIPFLAISYIYPRPQIARARSFWLGIAGAGIAAAALSQILLKPYAIQHSGGAVIRDLAEVERHSVQVFSFLRPFGRFAPWRFSAKVEEWQAYPTIALAILAFAQFAIMARRSMQCRGAPAWRRLAFVPATALALLFLLLSAAFQLGILTSSAAMRSVWSWLPVVCAAATLPACVSASDETRTRQTLWAFLGAGIFLAFLTLGPLIAITRHGTTFAAGNVLYTALYRYGPLLKGFRAACRFGVIVHFFMLCAAAPALESISAAAGRRLAPRRSRTWTRLLFGALFLAAVVLESIPRPNLLRRMRVDDSGGSAVIKSLSGRKRPFVLAVLPMGERLGDGLSMFTILKDRFLSYYAWCGYIPPKTGEVCDAIRHGDFSTAAAELETLWPECLILVDKSRPTYASPGYAKAYPSHIRTHHGRPYVDYPSAMRDVAVPISEDSRFTLMELRRDTMSMTFVRKFRSDFATLRPWARFAISPQETKVEKVCLNGAEIDFRAENDGTCSAFLPERHLAATGGNELCIELSGKATLDYFSLERHGQCAPGIQAGSTSVVSDNPRKCP